MHASASEPHPHPHPPLGPPPHSAPLLGMVGVRKCLEDSEEGQVAAALFGESTATAASIHRLAVAEEARGCGLGGALLRAAESFAASVGVTCVLAQVGSSSARAFYRHLGYERMDAELGEQGWFYRHLGGVEVRGHGVEGGSGSGGCVDGKGAVGGAAGGDQQLRHPSTNPLFRPHRC